MPGATALPVLLAISFCHLLNDMMQSLLPAMYPMLKTSFALDFTQIGLITLTFQLTASLLQPLIGLYTDHRPKPFSLMIGMGFTLVGLVCLSVGQELSRPARLRRRSWGSARRSSTRSLRGWRGWRPAGGTAWRSRCSRSAATPARRSGRSSPRSSCCRAASRASRGSRWRRCSRSRCSGAWAAGTGITAPGSRPSAPTPAQAHPTLLARARCGSRSPC